MLSAFRNAFKIPDLRKKILFTLVIIAVYRLGAHIPVPGLDFDRLQAALKGQGSNGVFGLINLFSGGALTQFAIFALGIMPYITSSIIMQLLTVVIPRLEAYAKEGEEGQKKITQYTRYMTVVLALLQSLGIVVTANSGKLLSGVSNIFPDLTAGRTFVIVLTLTAGEYELWAHASDEGYAPGRIEGIIVRAGETGEPVEFGLRPGLELEIALDSDVPPAESTIVLLEPEIWASVQAGPNVSDPTVSLGGVPYAAGPLSGFTLSDRIVIFLDGRHAKVSRLAAGQYRFKAFPPGIVIEPASVVLPHEEPLSIRWRYE